MPIKKTPAHEFARCQHDVATSIERLQIRARDAASNGSEAPRQMSGDIAVAEGDERHAELAGCLQRDPADETRILDFNDVRRIATDRIAPWRRAPWPAP